MFCPILTALLGPGGPGNIGITTKLGGMTIAQGANQPQNVAVGHFTRVGEALSMRDLFRDDLTSFA